jgi:hypothetical protein
MMRRSGLGEERIDLPHRIGIRMIPALSVNEGADGMEK